MTDGQQMAEPVMMEQFLQLCAEIRAHIEQAQAHWMRDERRMELIDRFVDPYLSLDLVIKQMHELLCNQTTALETLERKVEELERTVRTENETTRTALALHMSDPANGSLRERHC